MTLVKHKKVELTELFYDLVLVYGISKETALIHHLHHGSVPLTAFFAFLIGMVTMINSWMIQMVFTNRFGKNSLTNILFTFAQMALLLVSLSSVTGEFSHQRFISFYLPFLLISLLLFLQYFVEYLRSSGGERRLIQRFLTVLGLRSLGLGIALLLPYQLGLIAAVVSILGTWLLPGLLTGRRTSVSAEAGGLTSFPHLIERLSLLVIITFGEMIIGIADYFTPDRLSLQSFLIFLIVTQLFMLYIVEIDHMLDLNQPAASGNAAIYYHYPILGGLSFITVALTFLDNPEAQPFFTVSLLYLGILSFICGLLTHNRYNKTSHRLHMGLLLWELALPAFAWLLSLLFLSSPLILTLLAFISTGTMTLSLVRFNLVASKREGKAAVS